MIDSTLYPGLGLYNGKMGMILYYFLYARCIGNDIYEEKAMELIGDLQAELTSSLDCCYSEGLAGIGSAFCFLIENRFIEADPDELFVDFDQQMFSAVYFTPHRILSFDNGLVGIGSYYLHRINTSSDQNSLICMEQKMVLLSILDILSARFGMNGYTYPIEDPGEVSPVEMVDVLLFLEELKLLEICNELVGRLADHIIKNSGLSLWDKKLLSISSRPILQLKVDSLEAVMRKISKEKNEPILPLLAALTLENPSLPVWWDLF